MSDVEFRDLPGHPGYKAGSDGGIWSTKRWCGLDLRRMQMGRDGDGYPTVQLSFGPGSGGRTKVHAVHRLIASAWLPPRPSERHEVRHLDGDKDNSRPDNLAWGTRKENADDRERHGRTARGERGGAAKLTQAQVEEIRQRLVAGETLTSIANDYPVSWQAIGQIKIGRNWGGDPIGVKPKMAVDTVRAIRARFAAGASEADVSVEFGVPRTTVRDIRRGHTWKEVA